MKRLPRYKRLPLGECVLDKLPPGLSMAGLKKPEQNGQRIFTTFCVMSLFNVIEAIKFHYKRSRLFGF